jgi:hypothetical protein
LRVGHHTFPGIRIAAARGGLRIRRWLESSADGGIQSFHQKGVEFIVGRPLLTRKRRIYDGVSIRAGELDRLAAMWGRRGYQGG